AAVDRLHHVLRRRVQPRVMQLQRRVKEGERLVPPRFPPCRPVLEVGQYALPEIGIRGEPRPTHQVRLVGEVAQVVLGTAGAGVGQVADPVRALEASRLRGHLAVLAKWRLGPQAVIQRLVVGAGVGPRPTEIALYRSTLSCMRMLWYRASACSNTLARRSVA